MRRVESGDIGAVHDLGAVVVKCTVWCEGQLCLAVFICFGIIHFKIILGVDRSYRQAEGALRWREFICAGLLRGELCRHRHIAGVEGIRRVSQFNAVSHIYLFYDIIFAVGDTLYVYDIGERIFHFAIFHRSVRFAAAVIHLDVEFVVQYMSVLPVAAVADMDREVYPRRLSGLVLVDRGVIRGDGYLHRIGDRCDDRVDGGIARRGLRSAVAFVQVPSLRLPRHIQLHAVRIAVAVVVIIFRQRHLDVLQDAFDRRVVSKAADGHASVPLGYSYPFSHNRVTRYRRALGEALYRDGEAEFSLSLIFGVRKAVVFRLEEIRQGTGLGVLYSAAIGGDRHIRRRYVRQSRSFTGEVDFDIEFRFVGALRLFAAHAVDPVLADGGDRYLLRSLAVKRPDVGVAAVDGEIYRLFYR